MWEPPVQMEERRDSVRNRGVTSGVEWLGRSARICVGEKGFVQGLGQLEEIWRWGEMTQAENQEGSSGKWLGFDWSRDWERSGGDFLRGGVFEDEGRVGGWVCWGFRGGGGGIVEGLMMFWLEGGCGGVSPNVGISSLKLQRIKDLKSQIKNLRKCRLRKGSAEKGRSTKGTDLQQSTVKPDEGTDKQNEGTDRTKVSTDSFVEGTAEIKDQVSEKIDPKAKGKGMIKEEDESDTESEDITEAEKKFNMLANDERCAKRFKKEREAKRRRKEEEREKFTIKERAKLLHNTIVAQRIFLSQQRSEDERLIKDLNKKAAGIKKATGSNKESKKKRRDDLSDVYQLVMDVYKDKIPEGFDRVLWGDLMIMFNPSDEGVHTLMTDEGLVIHMLVKKHYPLRKKVLVQMLELQLESE
ncbi:hypothetical protein Tco_0966805 [Tanacetum coccineum]